MTQSGQGEQPSARPAREGIVLPSDGGEPLLPGMSGTPAPAAPAGGQAWGGSWGPGQQTPQQGQEWAPSPAPQWTGPEQAPSAANPGPLPPEGAPGPAYGGQAPAYGGAAPSYGGQEPAYGAPQPPGYGDARQQQHQPQAQQHQPSAPQYPAQPAPQYPERSAAAAPLPPAVPDGYPAAGAPLPPAADGATQYIPPVQAGPAGPADEGATQYLPPVQAAPADGATQYIPPVQAGPAGPADEGATQYLPPVPSGTLPHQSAGEETRYLGRVPQQPAPAPSDAEATQYIPPYTAQAQGADRQPPAEFDNLFRGGPAGGDSPAGSTQQLPRVQQADAYPGPSSHRPGQSSYGPDVDEDDGGRRRGRSRVPLIAAVGVGLVVLGVGAGALLSSGGGKDQGSDDKTVAAASPATQDSASPTADPARQQAVDLDKLLADSGSSRASVIQAVGNVRRCDNLDQAAGDLRDAAKQRSQLVTRLGELSVDKLPGNADLTAALTKAWEASAAADNHYAGWADQAKGRKVCHKGHARTTEETRAGNRESGTASAQKVKAAALWNTIAKKYGLTQRQPTQL
ncbi:hypothetical protein JK359_08000 [Streptomyces actinomycinicus]|uniref:Uncharacterized protein n=1 Tax=Streptomyces actinomycinicus TaxID=1695166 RepID=A0A937JL06_9ACTN|nr:hypothetical protein [Streptomyces actinomycinicus]MBL1081925.1 hypothetical protein [Streptomyces actinomycinicus]